MLPKYVSEMIANRRIVPATIDEQAENMEDYGYTFRLYRLNNHQWPKTLEEEAARLCAWAKREYAEARVARSVWFSDKEHRKPYYRRDYVLVVITDPVALWLEKAMKGAA